MNIKTVLVHVPEDIQPDELLLILKVSRDLPKGVPWAITLIDMDMWMAAVAHPDLDLTRAFDTDNIGIRYPEDIEVVFGHRTTPPTDQ